MENQPIFDSCIRKISNLRILMMVSEQFDNAYNGSRDDAAALNAEYDLSESEDCCNTSLGKIVLGFPSKGKKTPRSVKKGYSYTAWDQTKRNSQRRIRNA